MSHTIDLTIVDKVLAECEDLVTSLHGKALNEADADARCAQPRAERAERSRTLQLLATRLELAAAAARSEYWTARGHTDHLHPDRKD